MLRTLKRTAPWAAGLVLLVCSAGDAQFDPRGVAVHGTASKADRPEFLRMTLTVVSKGSNTQAAIESIRQRKQQAAIKLEKLEAIEDSIVFGPVTMGTESDGPSIQQMRMMMRGNFGDSEAAEKLMSIDPPVTVSVQVTADWLMPMGDEEELLLAIQDLKDRIIKSDVAGSQQPDELTPEQQELDAELSEMMNNYSSGEGGKPGEPVFTFGRRFSPDDSTALMKQAFADAETKAKQLAAAASRELGALAGLTSNSAASEYGSPYDEYNAYRYGRARQGADTDANGVTTVISSDPKEVKLQAHVQATFEIK